VKRYITCITSITQLFTYDLDEQKSVCEELKEKMYLVSENDPIVNKMIESLPHIRDEKEYQKRGSISSVLNGYNIAYQVSNLMKQRNI
jgi:hypothetical protein